MPDFYSHFLSLNYPDFTQFVTDTGPLDLGDRFVADPWEAMVRTVIGQQVSTSAARSIWQKVQSVNVGDSLFELFLDRPETLADCGLSRAKMRTISELLGAGRAGKLDLTALASAPYESRMQALLPFWGIGPWSVQMFSMFHANDPDVWSEGDLVLKKGLARFAKGQDPDDFLNATRPFRTYLALYCWHAAHVKLFD